MFDHPRNKMAATAPRGQTPNALSRFKNPKTGEDLQQLLYTLTKAILTARPLNIYSFIANFLENELTRRALMEVQSGIVVL